MICWPATGLVVALLYLMTGDRATHSAEDHGDIAPGTTADQAADAETRQAADHGADAG